MDADTVNRELSIARKAIGWWQRQGWIEGDPTIGIERRPAPPDRTKALAENQITALWRLDVALREKAQWKMRFPSWRSLVPKGYRRRALDISSSAVTAQARARCFEASPVRSSFVSRASVLRR